MSGHDAALAATAFTAACLVGLLVAEGRGSLAGRWIAKPLASAGFLATALAGGATGTPYGRAILAGLALSWLGDVLLIPGSVATFRLGLFSFLCGHVAFAVAFVRRGIDARFAGGAAVALAVAALVVARWVLPHVEAKMRPPVIAYIVVISAMVASAIGTAALHPGTLLAAGALAFYASDLAVARDTFVHKGFLNRLWGLPAYYGAQLLLAWSVAYG